MKKKINILLGDEAKKLGKYYGFWNQFFLYKKELLKNSLEVNFYDKINKNFLNGDYLFLNSRLFPKKKQFIDLEYLKKIKNQNDNLIWFDMRDSAGTTQFEVLPYVKKYIKKQFYKDKNIYEKNLEGGRYYTNYYIEKYNVKDDTSYESKSLKKSYLDKLVLGWNIGVCYFFDYVNFNKFDYYKEFLKLHFFKNSNFSMKLQNFQNWTNDAAKYDFVCLVNKYYDRNSVGFQRMELIKKLKGNSKLNYMMDLRLSKRDYYNILRKSKISIGAYGWGKFAIESLKQSNVEQQLCFPICQISIPGPTYISIIKLIFLMIWILII